MDCAYCKKICMWFIQYCRSSCCHWWPLSAAMGQRRGSSGGSDKNKGTIRSQDITRRAIIFFKKKRAAFNVDNETNVEFQALVLLTTL